MDAYLRSKLGMSPTEQLYLWTLYEKYVLPFGTLLTDLEAAGVLVNREHLAEAQKARARAGGRAGVGKKRGGGGG